jgi:hypothetical protein
MVAEGLRLFVGGTVHDIDFRLLRASLREVVYEVVN